MKYSLCISLFILFSFYAISQEKQVSFDLDCKVMTITSEINRSINLFTEFVNFKEATLFQAPDSSYILDIMTFSDNVLSRKKQTMTKQDGEALREKASRLLQTMSPNLLLDHEGRPYLLTGNLILGLGFYGWAAPIVLGLEEEAAYAGYCLTSAASFLIPYALTSNKDVSLASAHFSVFGGINGIFHGILLSELIGITSPGDGFGLTMLTSISENIIMYHIASGSGMKAGKASVIANYSLLGAFDGFMLNFLYDGYDEDRLWTLAPLAGSFAGYFLGNYVANTQDYTSGDATVSFMPAWLSLYLASSVTIIASNNLSPEAFSIVSILSTGIGAYIGNNLVKGRNFTESQGNYTVLAVLAGSLIGSGIGALLFKEDGNSDAGRFLPLAGCLGGIAGYTIAYEGYKGAASESGSTSSLDFGISPLAAIEGLKGNDFTMIDYNKLKPVSLPVIYLNYAF